MATIKDVAKAAGVSIATVSNIINGKTTTRNETWYRVQQAISDLNYRPSFSARNLRSNKSKMLGVILPRLNAFYSEIYNGIVDQLKNTAYFPILKLSMDDPLMESAIIRDFLEIGISGLLLVTSHPDSDPEIQEKLRNSQLPVVLIERDLPSLSCDRILFDNATLLYDAASAFDPGLYPEEIALVRLAVDHSSELDAQDGFLHALPDSPVVSVPVHRGEIFHALIKRFTRAVTPLKKLIATNYDIAIAARDVCSILGWNTEILALGGSNWSLSDSAVQIRLIPRHAYQAGRTAAQRLVGALFELDNHRSETRYVDKVQPHRIFRPSISQENCTVRVLVLDGDGADVLETLSVALTRETGVRFDFDRKSYDELKAAVQREIDGAAAYDILMIDKPWLHRCYQARLFTDLGSAVASEVSLQYPTFIYKVFYENRFRPYCIPFVAGVQAIYYRTDLFHDTDVVDAYWQKYGVQLLPPTSWSDYNRIASFFTGFRQGSYDFSYGTMLNSGETIGLVNEFLPRQWAFNGSLFDRKGRAHLDTIENERALKNLCETWKFTDPALYGNVWDGDIFDALQEGTVPMAIGFANHRTRNTKRQKSFDNFIEAAPMPRKRAMVGGYLLGISRTAERPDICKEYLRWIMSDRISVANMRMNGFIPTRAVYEDSYLSTLNPWFRLLEQCSRDRCTRESTHTILGEEVLAETLDAHLSGMVKKAIDGMPYRSALRETETALNNIILCK